MTLTGKTIGAKIFAAFVAMSLIIGASGAGKSVLMKILAGLIGREDRDFTISGSVRIAGTEILDGATSGGARPHVGIVFQNFALFEELTPEEMTELREWFAAFDAERWDRSFEPSRLAGVLAKLPITAHFSTTSCRSLLRGAEGRPSMIG